MRSFSVVFVVVKRLLPPRPTRIDCPGVAGLDGLIVATSNTRLAVAAIGVGGGGGGGKGPPGAGGGPANGRGGGPPPGDGSPLRVGSSPPRPSHRAPDP